jgi:hypothetical protein
LNVVFRSFLKQGHLTVGERGVGVVDDPGVKGEFFSWSGCLGLGEVIRFFVQGFVFGSGFSVEFTLDCRLEVWPVAVTGCYDGHLYT